MISANITTYIGQDSDAQHYYCNYFDSPNIYGLPKERYSVGRNEDIDLDRIITDPHEVLRMNDKHDRWYIGMETARYNSVEQIHAKLLELFPNEDMITYYEDKLFKETIYIKDGINLGVKAFGEVWTYAPSSYYKDLISDDVVVKIKCDDCGHEYTLDEVTYEQETIDHEGKTRDWVRFTKKRDMDEVCCKHFNLLWNVIL